MLFNLYNPYRYQADERIGITPLTVVEHEASSPSTHEGLLRVVPATFPGKQEHLTVWDRSSIRFLLQHRWAAITSHVPPSAERNRMKWSEQVEIHRKPVILTEARTEALITDLMLYACVF